MRFRVGLLFHSAPSLPFALGPVVDLLQKIDGRSATVRNGQQLTLVPFIRSSQMAAFSQAVIGTSYAVEAATFDNAGVAFGTLTEITRMQHPAYDDVVDFDLGMSVLVSRCAVLVILCQDNSEFGQIRSRLIKHHNTSVQIAIVPTQSDQSIFLEIDPFPAALDAPSWLVAVAERWNTMAAAPPPFPKAKTTMLGFLFPLVNSVIIGRRSETVKKKKPTPAERCHEGMGLSDAANKKLEPSDRKALHTALDSICPWFDRHDDLGRHYSNVFRTTCLLVPLFIVASTALAAAGAIDASRHDLWHISEGILLIAASVIFLRSKIAQYHGQWVQNRLLTELLRPVLFNSLFHTIPRLDVPAEEPGIWIQQSRIVLQHLRSLPSVALTTPRDYLLSARVSAITDFSNYQEIWHRGFADQHWAAEKRLARISAVAFIVTLCLCALQLISANYFKEATEIARGLMILTLVSTGIAFVSLLLSHQLGLEAIAERSSNAAEHFEALALATKQSGHAADARQVYAWAQECSGAILAEQHSWYRQIPLIRMHL